MYIVEKSAQHPALEVLLKCVILLWLLDKRLCVLGVLFRSFSNVFGRIVKIKIMILKTLTETLKSIRVHSELKCLSTNIFI